MTEKADPLKPSVALLSKLGSVVVHAQELFGPQGHHFDRMAMKTLLDDQEVNAWIKAMHVYLPLKRLKS